MISLRRPFGELPGDATPGPGGNREIDLPGDWEYEASLGLGSGSSTSCFNDSAIDGNLIC